MEASGSKYKISPEAGLGGGAGAGHDAGATEEQKSNTRLANRRSSLDESPSVRDRRLKRNVSLDQVDSVRQFMAKMREKYRPLKTPELTENHIKVMYLVSCYSETYERVMASKAARMMDKQESWIRSLSLDVLIYEAIVAEASEGGMDGSADPEPQFPRPS